MNSECGNVICYTVQLSHLKSHYDTVQLSHLKSHYDTVQTNSFKAIQSIQSQKAAYFSDNQLLSIDFEQQNCLVKLV